MGWISLPTRHTARTVKTCHWCGEQIQQGQLLVQWCGTTDGEFWVVKVHPECHAAWQALPPDERHEVYQGEFSRGCKCEQGHCKCSRQQRADIDNPTG